MIQRKRFGKKLLSVALAAAMVCSGVIPGNMAKSVVWAADGAAVLTEAQELASDTKAVAVGKLQDAIDTYNASSKEEADVTALQDAVTQFNEDNADQEKDETAKVKTDGWKNYVSGGAAGVCSTDFAPAITTYDRRENVNLAEVYETTTATTGTIIYQDITGLEPGTYKVGFYGNAFYTDGRGFASDMQDGATDVAYVFAKGSEANEQKEFITAKIATSTNTNNYRSFDITLGEADNGTIKLGMGKAKGGTNWHTMQIYQLTWFTTAKEVYAEDLAALKALLTDAETELNKAYMTEGKTEFQAAYDTALAASTSNKLNIGELETEIATFKEAMTTFKKANVNLNGKYYVKHVPTGKFMAAGKSWGTRGIVNDTGLDFVLTTDSNKKVTFDSKVYNGSNHFFGSNLFMDSESYKWIIDRVSENEYTIGNGSKYLSVDANDQLVLVDEAATWQFLSESDRIAALSTATKSSGVNATFFIGDADFNRNDKRVASWVVSKDCTNKNIVGDNDPNSGDNNDNGMTVAESYHSPFTISQALTNLPAGLYGLTAQGYYRQDNAAVESTPYFFANDAKGEVPVRTGTENSMTAAAASFAIGQYTIDPIRVVVGEDGKLTVGITNGSNKNQWVVFDNFRLTYYGPAVDVKDLAAKSLTYTGGEQELVTAGTATGGTLQYALGDKNGAAGEYSTTIPKATKPGDYYVWYKAIGDESHADVPPTCIPVSIAKKEVTITAKPQTIKEDESISALTDQAILEGALEGDVLSELTLEAGTGEDDGKIVPKSAVIKNAEDVDVTDNYNITYVEGDLTVRRKISHTVTFKVTGGSWNDEATEDVTVTLNGYEGDELKLTAGQIPAVGSKPAANHKNEGSWDVTPEAGTVITEDTIYTYTYTEMDRIRHTVTFKVVNGSWNDKTKADKTVTLTGYEGDTLKLADEDIPAVSDQPDDTYKAGSWDTVPSRETAITGDVTYTYTYAKKQEISAAVTFKVVNGSWNDKTKADKTVTLTGYEGDTLKLTDENIPAVSDQPDDTYKAGSWDTVPSRETAITGDVTYTYTYAKKQAISATVTFKVGNGSWNDETTEDVTVSLNGYEGDTLKLSADKIPAVGGKPAAGYKEGSWDVPPVADSVITENTTYTYTYLEEGKKLARVTFKVANGKWDDGTDADKIVTLEGLEEETLTLAADKIPTVGGKPAANYKAGSWDVTPVADTAITKDTTYTYTYAPKEKISAKVTFKVANGTWDDGKNADVIVTLDGVEGETLKLTADKIPAVGKKPAANYKAGSWDVTPVADTVITKDTTYTYTYAAENKIRAVVTFKVVNGAWNDGKSDERTVTLEGLEGETLKLKAENIPAAGTKPAANYKEGSWNTVPDTKTAITKDTTYTYTYAPKEKTSAKVTFKVVNGSWDDGKNADVTVQLDGLEGDTLKLTADKIPAAGKNPAAKYKAGKWDVVPDTETAIAKDTTYTYTYAPKERISAKVTFKVANGTWDDGKNEDVTVTLEGLEGDSLKLAADQIPAAGKNPIANHKAGSWDVKPDTETAITKDTTYTYSYVEKEKIHAAVTFNVANGAWDDGGRFAITYILSGYEGETLKLAADQIPAVGKNPIANYKEGSWDVTPAAGTEIKADTVYTYTYAEKNKVNAKVTFKVADGSWNDGTTEEKTVTVSAYEGETLKLAADQIPFVGNKPAEGYKRGSWDVKPAADTVLTEDTTYTYTYAPKEKISAKVTFKVANGTWDDGKNADVIVTLDGLEGETLKLAADQIPAVGKKPAAGYKEGSWDAVPIAGTVITKDTTYTYTYEEKGKISAKVTFKVAGGSWDDETAEDKTVTVSAYEGEILKLAADQIPAVGTKPAANYKSGSWDVAPTAGAAITEDIVYTYTYAPKEKISAKVTFKVANGAWDDGKNADVTVTLTGYEGDTLQLTADQIPAAGKKPAANYKAGSWDVTPGTGIAITEDMTYTYTYQKDDTPAPAPTPNSNNNNNNGKETGTSAGGTNGASTADGTKETSSAKTVTVTKEGSTYNISGSTATVTAISKTAESVVINTVKKGKKTYKVTAVADGAFKNSTKLTTVTIGENVTTIGANAFSGCTKLAAVTIGENVTTIGANTFSGCKKLKTVIIGKKVKKIGKNAFKNCKGLKIIRIKGNVKKIGKNAFKGMKKNVIFKVSKKYYKKVTKLLKKCGIKKSRIKKA